MSRRIGLVCSTATRTPSVAARLCTGASTSPSAADGVVPAERAGRAGGDEQAVGVDGRGGVERGVERAPAVGPACRVRRASKPRHASVLTARPASRTRPTARSRPATSSLSRKSPTWSTPRLDHSSRSSSNVRLHEQIALTARRGCTRRDVSVRLRMPADDAITGRDHPQRPRWSRSRRRASSWCARRHSTFIQEGADACARAARRRRPARRPVDRDQPHARRQPAVLAARAAGGLPARTMAPGDVFAHERPVPRRHPRQRHRRVPADLRRAAGVVFFAGTLIHVADVGGVVGRRVSRRSPPTPSPRGCCCRPCACYATGEPVGDVLRIIDRNSRAPDKVVGDVQALVAGANVDRPPDRRAARALRRRRRSRAFVDRDLRRHRAPDPRRARRAARRDLRRLASRSTATASTGPHVRGAGRGHGRRRRHRRHRLRRGRRRRRAVRSTRRSRRRCRASSTRCRCFVDPTIPMNEGCFRPARGRACRRGRW